MSKKKYIMWSDGVVSSFGELVSREEKDIVVKNPMVVMFQVINEPVFELDENGNVKIDDNGQPIMKIDDNGQPIMKGGLKWDMNPYVFGACLRDGGDNIWSVSANSVISEDAEFDERLIGHYTTLVRLCGNANEG